MTALDQIFVNLKLWLVALFPVGWQPWLSILITIATLILGFALLFGITTVIERKGLGRIQNRRGPNRVGIPFTKIRLAGFGQFLADGVKMLTKEDIVPRAADRVVHFLAPLALVVPVLLTFSVLPYGRNMVPIELDAGLLFFFALGSATELSVFMAGWSSGNKYSLLGAMRAIAQMISYELPLVIASLTVVMMAGSLSLPQIVAAQGAPESGGLARWFVFAPWGLAGFLLFLVALSAESNRTPFDLPEAESELVAGYFTEYSGFKFALLFLGEYLGLFGGSGLAVTLFLGGWQAPASFLGWVPSWLWFFGKLFAMIALFIWFRGTLPRLRTDQLLGYAWRFLLPMTLVNLVSAALWHYSAAWNLPGGVLARWGLCAALIVVPFVLLGRAVMPKIGPRVYRYAS
jgi:NADH-quinone oxidoreductase subunit H